MEPSRKAAWILFALLAFAWLWWDQRSEPPARKSALELIPLNGSTTPLPFDQAEAACLAQGMRVPTLREIATWAAARGAVFSADAAGKAPVGSHRYQAWNPDGAVESFLYGPGKFQLGNLGEADTAFWTSSACRGCGEGSRRDSLFVLLGDGRIGDYKGTIRARVLCVAPIHSRP